MLKNVYNLVNKKKMITKFQAENLKPLFNEISYGIYR